MPSPATATAIVWFRRDLRLADNPALEHALAQARRIVPVFAWDPAAEAPWLPGAASRWWLHHSLQDLSAQLAKRGAPLLLRRGGSAAVLLALARETGATAVFCNRLPEPALQRRDASLARELAAAGIALHATSAALLLEPDAIRNGAGEPYRVFTPFWKALRPRLQPAQVAALPRRLPGVAGLASEPLESLALLPRIAWDAGLRATWTPGEDGAHARLERFCDEALEDYPAGRDHPGTEATSRLSPHLHFGEIGPRQIAARLQRLQAGGLTARAAVGADAFLREVAWREFGHHLLQHFPHTPEQPLDVRFAHFPWRAQRDYADDLRAWQRGTTGIPLVDAGMRELWHTGWMHNRVRMVVGSLLTKNLLIPWQEGARWFWDTLVDADLANNTLGWQWIAGCGADAAPYFRVFNPVLQGQRFGAAAYIRRWVPELARLPDADLHAPWEAGALALQAAGVRLGRDYPEPRVLPGPSRERALAAWAAFRGG